MKFRLLLAALLFVAPLFAQQGTAFVSTPAQHRKLVSRRDQIVKLQEKISTLQIELTFRASQFKNFCREIAMGNTWPAEVQCDISSLMFYIPAGPAPPINPPNPPQPATPAKP